ncbi:vomeronasal type-2 receptor 116-like [Dipodomys merriami]|uniref:vomeronasal type-2 receptor 116-like n=1 Tax=Dipodomys merriami TaxID=94247 RepID=UPI003855BF67
MGTDHSNGNASNHEEIMLQLPLLVRSSAGTSCFSTMKHRAHMGGDMMVSGLFPLYTLGMDHRSIQASQQEENSMLLSWITSGCVRITMCQYDVLFQSGLLGVVNASYVKRPFFWRVLLFAGRSFHESLEFQYSGTGAGPSVVFQNAFLALCCIDICGYEVGENLEVLLYWQRCKDVSQGTLRIVAGDLVRTLGVPLRAASPRDGSSMKYSQIPEPVLAWPSECWFICKNYQLVLAMAFAIEEINKNPDLLHNMTLGFDVYNVELRTWTMFKNPFIWLYGKYEIPNYSCMRDSRSIAVLTGPSAITSDQIGTLLGLYRFPQFTFGPFDHTLSDHNKFPALYQMDPKDTSIATAMVSLLLHFSWNWVGLFTSQDENGSWFLAELKEEMAKNRVCVDYEIVISTQGMSHIQKTMAVYHDINKSAASVLIIYADNDSLIALTVCIEQIFTQDAESDCVTWDNCLHDASLDWLPGHSFDMTMSGDSYNIYNAVYAVAQALHEMLLHQTEIQTMGNRKETVPSPAQMYPFLKNSHWYSPTGDQVIWDKKRKLKPEYDILNIWNFPEGLELAVNIGKFSPYAPHSNHLSLSEDLIEWAIRTTETPHSVCSESCGPGFRKSPQEGKAACCFDCTPCPENEIANRTDMEQCVKCAVHQYANTQRNQCLVRAASFLAFGDPLGMALACMALCFSMLSAAVLGMFVKYQDAAIVKANNQTLSYILLISLILCFLCSLLFLGRPNTVTCILQQVTFGIVFTVAVSTVLAKTVTVVLAFKATSPGRKLRWLLVSGAPKFIIPICTLIQVTLCGLWLGTSPPFIDTDAHSEHGHIIILCNKGSLTAFYCVLGYLGSLAMASFTVAFLARNLPDTFNEAKFLTFSMLVFCSVWLTFLPVYHSAKGKVMVAVEVFSILASGAGLLGCIFAPKCIILLMPNSNPLHGIRDKRHSRRH